MEKETAASSLPNASTPVYKPARHFSCSALLVFLPIFAFIFCVGILITCYLLSVLSGKEPFYPLPTISNVGGIFPSLGIFSWGLTCGGFFVIILSIFKFFLLRTQFEKLFHYQRVFSKKHVSIAEREKRLASTLCYESFTLFFEILYLVLGIVAGICLGLLAGFSDKFNLALHMTWTFIFFVSIFLQSYLVVALDAMYHIWLRILNRKIVNILLERTTVHLQQNYGSVKEEGQLSPMMNNIDSDFHSTHPHAQHIPIVEYDFFHELTIEKWKRKFVSMTKFSPVGVVITRILVLIWMLLVGVGGLIAYQWRKVSDIGFSFMSAAEYLYVASIIAFLTCHSLEFFFVRFTIAVKVRH